MMESDSFVRTLGIALAVGLDVLALSVGIGVLGVPWSLRIRVGAAFAAAEIGMQIVGAAIGTGAGRIVGEFAADIGLVVLGLIGAWIVRESFNDDQHLTEQVTGGWGLVAASASISLDSLGIGFSLPSLHVPLLPLIGTVAVTTIVFTLAGLRFGEILGARFQKKAERGAGIVLLLLAVLFAFQRFA